MHPPSNEMVRHQADQVPDSLHNHCNSSKGDEDIGLISAVPLLDTALQLFSADTVLKSSILYCQLCSAIANYQHANTTILDNLGKELYLHSSQPRRWLLATFTSVVKGILECRHRFKSASRFDSHLFQFTLLMLTNLSCFSFIN